MAQVQLIHSCFNCVSMHACTVMNTSDWDTPGVLHGAGASTAALNPSACMPALSRTCLISLQRTAEVSEAPLCSSAMLLCAQGHRCQHEQRAVHRQCARLQRLRAPAQEWPGHGQLRAALRGQCCRGHALHAGSHRGQAVAVRQQQRQWQRQPWATCLPCTPDSARFWGVMQCRKPLAGSTLEGLAKHD